MARAYLSLGSNMGDRRGYLAQACHSLAEAGEILGISSLYASAPWGKTDQEEFYNAALILDTEIKPLELLHFCQHIEGEAQRKRLEHWGPRTLDVDIIAYEGVVSSLPELILPHPWYKQRLFVLQPLWEIAGDIELEPGASLADLVQNCQNTLYVHPIASGQWWLRGKQDDIDTEY